MKFYQGCYGKPQNKWEALNLSPDAPPHITDTLKKRESSCTPELVGHENIYKEDGSQILLYELTNDENVTCVIRAKFIESSSSDRAKMFAHGFAFESQGLLEDPNNVLTVADSNFKFDAESTEAVPSVLSTEAPFSLSESLCAVGLDREKWEKLMGCVYVALQSRTDFPLFVVCPDDMRTIKSAIYSILSALPYQFRYLLSFSNANSFRNANFKCVVFTETKPNNKYFFDVATGETNLNLSEITDAPQNFFAWRAFTEKSTEEFALYCKELSTIAEKLGYPYNAGFEDMAIAHTILSGTDVLRENDDRETVHRYLLELLSGLPYQNLFADDYIAGVLKTFFVEKNAVLNDAFMKRIEVRGENSQSELFIECYKKLKVSHVLSKGNEEAVSFLANQAAKSEEKFLSWCALLEKAEKGNEAVAFYYCKKILLAKDYAAIHAECVAANKNGYWRYPAVQNTAKKAVCSITVSKVSVENLCSTDFIEVVRSMKNLLVALFADNHPEVYTHVISEVRKSFWGTFALTDFDFNERCIINCKKLSTPTERNSIITDTVIELYETIQKYKAGSVGYRHIEKAFYDISEKLCLSDEETAAIAKKVRDLIYNALSEKEGNGHFCLWAKIATFGDKGKNPLPQMAEWALPVICDENAFMNSFDKSQRMKDMNEEILEWLVGSDMKGGYLATVDSGSDIARTLKAEAKYILDYRKQLAHEEKNREKAEKKLEKQQKKDSKRAPDTQNGDDSVFYGDIYTGEENDRAPQKKKGILGFFDKMKK